MGIRPTGNGPKPVYASDDTTGRYQNWVSDLEQAGDTGGDVIAEIDAKANSSNTTAAELAADITMLENRIAALESAPSPDLSAKQDKITLREQPGAGVAIKWRRWGNVVSCTAPALVDAAALRNETVPAWAVPSQLEGVAAIGSTTGSAVYVRTNAAFTVTGTDTQVRFTLTYIVN